MATVLDDVFARPYMLNDIIMQAQRLSAALPPDDWDAEAERQGLIRQPSGVFDLVSLISRNDTENEQLICGVPEPSSTPKGKAEDVGWLKRVSRTICRCLCGHRNEE